MKQAENGLGFLFHRMLVFTAEQVSSNKEVFAFGQNKGS